jgi:hypothetical protein
MELGRALVRGVLCLVLFLGGASAAAGQEVSHLVATFRVTLDAGQPVVSGTLHAWLGDSAVDWFQVVAGDAATAPESMDMIIRIETDGNLPHRICHRRTGAAGRGRLTCADGSQLRTHWEPSEGSAGSIEVYLPTRGGVLHPPASMAVILLAGPAAPFFEIHIPYREDPATTQSRTAGADGPG